MRRTRETSQFIVQNKILVSEHELDCSSVSSDKLVSVCVCVREREEIVE